MIDMFDLHDNNWLSKLYKNKGRLGTLFFEDLFLGKYVNNTKQ